MAALAKRFLIVVPFGSVSGAAKVVGAAMLLEVLMKSFE